MGDYVLSNQDLVVIFVCAKTEGILQLPNEILDICFLSLEVPDVPKVKLMLQSSIQTKISKAAIETGKNDGLKKVFIHHDVLSYITKLILAIRRSKKVYISSAGISSNIAMYCKSVAFLENIMYVNPDAVITSLPYVIGHLIRKEAFFDYIDGGNRVLEWTDIAKLVSPPC